MSLFFALVAGAAMQQQPVAEAPIQLTVQGVGVERTIAEFMDICFRPKWNVDDVRKAVKESDPTSIEQQSEDSNSFVWDSTHWHLALHNLPQLSQCALSIGSIESRTGKQLLAILRPAVEAELGHAVQEDDARYFLQWSDPNSGYVERITLARADSNPQQAIWYVFDKTAPGVREKFDAMYPPQNSSK